MEHQLKLLPAYWADVYHGIKKFEVRKNDRDFRIGDILELCEWAPSTGYSGRAMRVRVIYMLADSTYLREGYCVLGIARCNAGMKAS